MEITIRSVTCRCAYYLIIIINSKSLTKLTTPRFNICHCIVLIQKRMTNCPDNISAGIEMR